METSAPPGTSSGPTRLVASGRRISLGIIAQGRIAVGIVAMGGVSIGVVALGGIAIGVIALGGLAVGGMALGGIVFGWKAVGAVAFGVALTQGAAKWLLGATCAGMPRVRDQVIARRLRRP